MRGLVLARRRRLLNARSEETRRPTVKRIYLLCLIVVSVFAFACSQPAEEATAPDAETEAAAAPPEPERTLLPLDLQAGLYEARTARNESFTISFVRGEDGSVRVGYVGYDFEASLGVGQVLLQSREPFGETKDNLLVFHFPIFKSFAPSGSLAGEGGTAHIAYYRGEVFSEKAGEITCELSELDDPDTASIGEFTMQNINLASPPPDEVLEKSYSFTLTPKT
jgi:hypothetical protein